MLNKKRLRRRQRGEVKEATEAKPVWVGLMGGSYKPLAEADLAQIYETALAVLAEIGLAEPIPALLEVVLPRGCVLGENGRLCFPRSLVEAAIAHSPKQIIYHAPNPNNDQVLDGNTMLFGTSGEGVTILDYKTRRYRPSTLLDLYDAGRLVDQLEHIHTFGQPFIASEFSHDLLTHDINVAYAELAATNKPFHMGLGTAAHVDRIIAMFDLFVGGKGEFVKRPFCSFGGCPIVSPLTFARDSLEVMMRCAELGITYDVAVAAQAGATAPAALAGCLVQTFAETLACLTVTYLINPQAPMLFGMWPFISDLRTGAFSGGGAEQTLVMAATAQLCAHYGLVSSVASGMTDANMPDGQAGFEKGISTVVAALAGGNSISSYPGAVGSLMGSSLEALLIDNEMMGMVMRVVRGIEVDETTLSFDVIRETVNGPGHYLGNPQTVALMKSEFLYPTLADRRDTTTWEEAGSPTIYERAHRRVRTMLRDYYPAYIAPELDRQIRALFDIRLPVEVMRVGNGRW